MPLEHDAPRFTPEQRDAILDLAARLQTHHEATVGADELMRAAAEAGLDPRFIHEAAMRLGRKSPALSLTGLTPLGMFVAQAAFFVFVQNPSVPGGRMISSFELSFAIPMAFVLALWAARNRTVRPFVPLAPLAVWLALYFATTLLTAWNGVAQNWVLQDCVVFGLAQAAAALFGTIAASTLDRSAEMRPFRLHRGRRA